ncbi:hypothetical protein EK904_011583 [Melospiza melodia maxima]|nr:hypothetical protein EK904_011583 [Melospiza melodia maxima]
MEYKHAQHTPEQQESLPYRCTTQAYAPGIVTDNTFGIFPQDGNQKDKTFNLGEKSVYHGNKPIKKKTENSMNHLSNGKIVSMQSSLCQVKGPQNMEERKNPEISHRISKHELSLEGLKVYKPEVTMLLLSEN